MEPVNITGNFSDFVQISKYAEDFGEIYSREKGKRKELQASNQQLLKYALDLHKSISELKAVHQELRKSYLDTIYRLVLAAEYKDDDTGDHIVRISRYSALIAEKLGLSNDITQNILYAAPMHDVGKIGIPDNILQKPGKLTDKEFDLMKTHVTIGANILANSNAEIIQLAQKIALTHHEKWNGKGYPQGHSKEEIPLVGRIVGLADTFDALISKRPYKDPYPSEVAVDIIKKEREEHFDPDVVDIFLGNIDGFLKIRAEVSSPEDVPLSDFTWSERDRLEGKDAIAGRE